MKHLVLTRSAYPAAYPIKANRRRLELLRHVAAASLRSQAERRFEWVVTVDPDDPLYDARVAALETAGVPVHLIPIHQTLGSKTARGVIPDGRLAADVGRPWREAIEAFVGPSDRIATTRMDDDDALSRDALLRVRAAMDASPVGGMRALVMPVGLRYHRGRVHPMHHRANMFITLDSPRDPLHVVMEAKHLTIARFAPVSYLNRSPGWLWVRHADTRSASRRASRPPDVTVRRQFGVDWAFLRTVM